MDRYFIVNNPWWSGDKYDYGLERSYYVDALEKNFDQRLMQILTGLRRVGKSTIAKQFINRLVNKKQVDPKKILFFSIEEPSLAKKAIVDIINDFRKEHEIPSREKIYVFIDEIQFRKGWEAEIKSLYDSENIKFVLTGSSALLLSENLSFLTGRYLKMQVFPLSFAEYLDFINGGNSNADTFLLERYSLGYIQTGGMPEFVLNKIDRYLETTVESILYKDIVTKFKLRNPQILSDLLYLLSDRVSSTTGSVKLSKVMGLNKDTLLTYQNYLKLAYITHDLRNFSNSRNKEVYNPVKYYFSDNGICNTYSSKTNLGALAENAIHNHIKSHIYDKLRVKFGYWHEDKEEMDFVVSINEKLIAIEFKFVDTEDEIDFKSLSSFLKKHKPNTTLVVTKKVKKDIEIDGHRINMIPIYDFLRVDITRMYFE